MDEWNPQCYSLTGAYGGGNYVSWRREADEIDYERTWFKVQRSWVGSPVGFWDPGTHSHPFEDLYANWQIDRVWHPKMEASIRRGLYHGWLKAVERTFDWVTQ